MAHALLFSPSHDKDFFEQLPAAAAVFVLRGDGEPYVSKTANLRRRLQRLLEPPLQHSKRLNLRDRVREIEFTPTGSDFESQFLLYRILRETFPKTYLARLRLRPAPLVKLHLENKYPRASVTTRFSLGGRNCYYGPFVSRAAAETFASDSLDFFKMRRCVEDLHPDPAFPGCVYSEMKMCLAPCFKACTDAEYATEVGRVQSFFASNGESLRRELESLRDKASADLAFEDAATIHAKLEKLHPVLSQLPDIVHRIDQLRAIIIQPGVALPGHAVKFFLFQACTLHGPVDFSIEPAAETRSTESRVEAGIATFPLSGAGSAAEHTEHLAILKRWFYRSTRTGEIFFANANGAWPMRRIVRGMSRVARGEKLQEQSAGSATQSPLPSSVKTSETGGERE